MLTTPHPFWRVHAERGEEVPSTNDADIYAFTSADVDQGWTGLRPGDIVTFTPSPTATLGKGAAKVLRLFVEIYHGRTAHADPVCPFRFPRAMQPRPRALAITLERPADEKRVQGFVVGLKDTFGFLKSIDLDNVRCL